MNKKEREEIGGLFEVAPDQMEAICNDLTNAEAGGLVKALFAYFEMTYKADDDRAEKMVALFREIVDYNEGDN